MHYLIARDGQQLGQFSEEEIRSGLFEGKYLSTDVAWTEGMSEWQPLGEIMGQGVTRVAGPRTAGNGGPIPWTAPTHTAGLAITALVVGIISLVTCGGLGVGAIAAIVCGHLALSSIGKSGGLLGGRGMALSGLIMGYVSIVGMGVMMMVAVSGSAMSKMAEKGQITKGISTARQLAIGIRLYAADHEGKYPATLEELVAAGTLEKKILDDAEGFKPVSWQGTQGFDYHGAGMRDSDPPEKVLLTSRAWDTKNRRVVVTNDAGVELKVPPAP